MSEEPKSIDDKKSKKDFKLMERKLDRIKKLKAIKERSKRNNQSSK